MKKRLFSLAVVVALAITSLSACSPKDTKKEDTPKVLTKVTLNEVAHSIFYAPMYVAIEEGYFKDAGIDLTLVTGFGVLLLIQDIFMKFTQLKKPASN